MLWTFYIKNKSVSKKTVFNIDNCSDDKMIVQMISEGSCDTEDWGNIIFQNTIEFLIK